MSGNPLFEPALELATGGRPISSGEDLMRLARALVFLVLEHGPRAMPELPRAWPVTRVLLRDAIRDLLAEGLVARSPVESRGAVGLTAVGRAHLLAATGQVRRSA
jgi:hypothetical protein